MTKRFKYSVPGVKKYFYKYKHLTYNKYNQYRCILYIMMIKKSSKIKKKKLNISGNQ